jgi:Ca2+-binding RTX toxin-like protein
MTQINAGAGSNAADTIRGSASTNWMGTSIDPAPGTYIYNAIYNYQDTIQGLAGNDIIIGDLYDSGGNQNYGADRLYGGLGNDTIYSDTGPEDLGWKLAEKGGGGYSYGGFGNDTLHGGGSTDGLWGEGDHDTLYGYKGEDRLYGGDGNDTLDGGDGDDWSLEGGDGKDVIRGGEGDDAIFGGAGSDVIYGDAGGDSINGEGNGGSRDTRGIDTLTYIEMDGFVFVDLAITAQQDTGFGGLDSIRDIESLIGSNFNDRLSGANVAETLSGAAGNDVLSGRGGNDRLDGGLGNDVMDGGAGRDKFCFTTKLAAANKDKISGFKVVDDTIVLSKAIFKAVGATLSAGEFHIGANAHDADDRIIYNKQLGELLYDADGTGAQAAVSFASINKGLAMTFDDFLIA